VDKEGTGLNSPFLYRAGAKLHLQAMVDKQQVPPHNGFYSPKDTYSGEYLGGTKGKGGTYEAMIIIELNGTFYDLINAAIAQKILNFQNVGSKEKKEVFGNFRKNYRAKSQDCILKFEENVYNCYSRHISSEIYLKSVQYVTP
jgi:hypothetical protein